MPKFCKDCAHYTDFRRCNRLGPDGHLSLVTGDPIRRPTLSCGSERKPRAQQSWTDILLLVPADTEDRCGPEARYFTARDAETTDAE